MSGNLEPTQMWQLFSFIPLENWFSRETATSRDQSRYSVPNVIISTVSLPGKFDSLQTRNYIQGEKSKHSGIKAGPNGGNFTYQNISL